MPQPPANISGLVFAETMETPAADAGLSGMEGIAAGSFAMSAGSAIAGICSSIIGYVQGKKQMESQRDSQISTLDHQDKMAGIQKEMVKDQAIWQEKGIAAKVDGQKQYNAAVEERAKAESQLKVVKARIEEKKKSEKTGKLDTKAVDRLFRGKYSFGSPVGF